MSGRAAVAAVLGAEATTAAASPPASPPCEAPSSARVRASVAIADVVRGCQEQTLLDPNDETHQQVIDAVVKWGRVEADALPFSFTAESTMSAIVRGLQAPLALPALGLGLELTRLLQHGDIQAHVLAGLAEAGASDSVMQQVETAMAQDVVLLSAQQATASWELSGKSSEHWRRGRKRMRTWFLEVTFYRVLAKLKLLPPTLEGSQHDKAAVTLLQPSSIPIGIDGQIAAATHLAGLLSPAANQTYHGFGGYANSISTTSGQNRGSFETSAEGISLSNCCRRYCRERSARARSKRAASTRGAVEQASHTDADGQGAQISEQAAAEPVAAAPSTSAAAQPERPLGVSASASVPPTVETSTAALLWPTTSRKRRGARKAERASKRYRADSSPDVGRQRSSEADGAGGGVHILTFASYVPHVNIW